MVKRWDPDLSPDGEGRALRHEQELWPYDAGMVASNAGMGSVKERCQAIAAAGFDVVLLDVFTHQVGEWEAQGWVETLLDVKVPFGPWGWVEAEAHVRAIEEARSRWGSPVSAYNLERVDLYDPMWLADAIRDLPGFKAVVTLPWAQNDRWAAFEGENVVASPEAFMNARKSWSPDVVSQHAIDDEHFPVAVPWFGAGQWSDAPLAVGPDDYFRRWEGEYLVFELDNIPVEKIAAWKRP